jgi:tetratricopeptide (TPR) repeat protein/nitrate/TMAO reductase-like tetraheme cytochrome c subunit
MLKMQRSNLMIIAFVAITVAALWAYRTHLVNPSSDPDSELTRILDQFSAQGAPHADPANCVECHREITTAWQDSHHALANAALSEIDRERLIANTDSFLKARGMRYHSTDPSIRLEETGLPSYPVVGSIGLTPLIQYLHLAPDGRIQAHDVAWDVEQKEWFSVFEIDDKEEATPRQQGEWGHWTGQGMNWDANCAYCHMTEYAKNYDPVEDRYDREWAHMGITCAQCHPGMDTHLDQVRNGNNAFKESLSPEQVMEYCATCHSRRDELTPHAFRPGDNYEDHFELTLASVPDIYHPDGQVIGENYVYGSLMMSRMGHAGVTCMDCHDPHTNGHILPFENNALCMRCHGSGLMDAPRIDPVGHSHHPANSTGNQCVECHMPVTYFMGRDGRRDHSFSNPDPQLTLELGIPNACSQCHNTQSVEWAKRYTDEWYGPDMNADRRAKARLMDALWSGMSGADARLRAALGTEQNRFWKATFVSMLQYTAPHQESFEILQESVEDPDPMVRSAAVKVLRLENLSTQAAGKLQTDPVRSVRIASALASQGFATASPEEEAELAAYLTHTADTPMGAIRLSAFKQSRGDLEAARFLARQATRFEPLNPETWRITAIQLHGLNASAEAMEHLEKALSLDPDNTQVLFNRALLHNELGNTNAALEDLLSAVEADPAFESAWFNLVVLYWQLQQPDTARAKLQEALTHLPQSQRLRQLAGQLGQAF